VGRKGISCGAVNVFPLFVKSSGWLYFRFSLSFRDIEEIMAERGVVLTYETVRQWCLKFGQTYATELKHRRGKAGDKWHLDEVFLKINGKTHYLWRAVDQDGNVLDILVQSRRNKHAAKKFFRKLLKGLLSFRCECDWQEYQSHSRSIGSLSIERRKQRFTAPVLSGPG
jgi:hypothetical protein